MEEQTSTIMSDKVLLIEEVAIALQENNFRHFLNLAEMEIITFHEEFDFAEAELEKIEAAPDSYLEIIADDSKEAYEVSAAFTGSLTDEKAQQSLRKALSGRRPFASFKDALSFMPETLQAWYDYQNRHYRNKARQWLLNNGLIEA